MTQRNGRGRRNGKPPGRLAARNGNADHAARQVARFRAHPLRPSEAAHRAKGELLIIGGHEDKEDDKVILRYLAQRVGSGALVVVPVASEEPDAMWAQYEGVLRRLGLRHVKRLSIESRLDAESPTSLRVLQGATAVFLTGGDQLRLTLTPHNTEFRVLGEGAAYVVDGSSVTETNIAEGEDKRAMSLYHVTVHVLTQGDEFHVSTRTPVSGSASDVEEEIGVPVRSR
jgi:cyanophycinase-like exopeptidase